MALPARHGAGRLLSCAARPGPLYLFVLHNPLDERPLRGLVVVRSVDVTFHDMHRVCLRC